jgi:predicted transcriptional regulator
MSQIEFDFGHPARATDPDTSHIAADMLSFRNAHFKAILHVLTEPLGKSKIALFSGLDGAQVCRRLTEMERAGLIETTGKNVNSTSNRPEREWRKKL